MQEVRFADGLDTPDRIAFGLGAWQLLAVVGGVVLAYAMAHSPLPAGVSAPLAATTAALTAALGWLRLAGRPLLEWSVFAVRFLAGARSGRLLIQNEPAGQPAVEMPVPPRASPAFRSVVVPLRPYVLEDAAETAAAPPAIRLSGLRAPPVRRGATSRPAGW